MEVYQSSYAVPSPLNAQVTLISQNRWLIQATNWLCEKNSGEQVSITILPKRGNDFSTTIIILMSRCKEGCGLLRSYMYQHDKNCPQFLNSTAGWGTPGTSQHRQNGFKSSSCWFPCQLYIKESDICCYWFSLCVSLKFSYGCFIQL